MRTSSRQIQVIKNAIFWEVLPVHLVNLPVSRGLRSRVRISMFFFLALCLCCTSVAAFGVVKEHKTIGLYSASPEHAEDLKALFADGDSNVKILNEQQLAQLNQVGVSLLIIGQETTFPPTARRALDTYMAEGNNLVLLSGEAFDYSRNIINPVRIVDFSQKSYHISKPDDSQVTGKIQKLMIKTCEQEDAIWMITPQLGLGDIFVDIPTAQYRSSDRSMISFKARGDYEVDTLTLKIRDRQGNEWFRFLELGRDWETFKVSTADFMPAKASKHSGPLDPSKIETLSIGLESKTIWYDKPGSFALGPVYLGEASRFEDVVSSELRKWRVPLEIVDAHYPGWIISPFLDGAKFEQAVGIEVAGRQNIFKSPAEINYKGLCEVPPFVRNAKSRARLGTDKDLYKVLHETNIRRVPLLIARDTQGRELGPVAEVRFHLEGPHRRSGLALFGVEGVQYSASSTMGKLLKETCAYMLYQPRIRKLTLYTSSMDESPEKLLCQVSLDNPLSIPVKGKLTLSAAKNRINSSRPFRIEARQTQECVMELGTIGADFPLTDFDWKLTLETEQGTDVIEDHVSVEKSLIRIAKNMLELRKTHRDRRISNHFFTDMYGARALLQLGLYLRDGQARQRNADVLGKLTGEDFIRSAGELADMMAVAQDPDGSIPLGYNEIKRIRWVADNGSNALGLAQMASWFENKFLRQRWLETARRYVDWRNTFYISPEKSRQLREKFGKDKWTRPGNYGFGYMHSNWDTKEDWPERRREERGPDYVLGICIGVMGALDVLVDCPLYHDIAIRDTKHFLDGDYSAASYFQAEGIFWMYYTLDDKGIEKRIKDLLKESFLPSVINDKKYQWFSRGSRSSLLWLTLAYYHHYIEDTAAVRASLLKAIWELCSESSEMSMDAVAERYSHSSHGNSISASKYAGTCSAIWLVELLNPGCTLLKDHPVD